MIYNVAVYKTNRVQLPPMGKSLEEYTWEEIDQISQAGEAANYFEIGDCKSVKIQGTVGTKAYDDIYYVYIIGINHDGDGRITFGGFTTTANHGVEICLTDSKYGGSSTDGTLYFNMNHKGDYNHGGWAACDLRYDILGSTDQEPDNYNVEKTAGNKGYNASAITATNPVANTLMAALPVELRKYMKPMMLYTDNVGGGTNTTANVTTTVDYLPLLAEYEIFGAQTHANSNEQSYQKQYNFYVNANSKVRYSDSTTTSAVFWWERSPTNSTMNTFCCVHRNGSAYGNRVYYSYGLAPAFKI